MLAVEAQGKGYDLDAASASVTPNMPSNATQWSIDDGSSQYLITKNSGGSLSIQPRGLNIDHNTLSNGGRSLIEQRSGNYVTIGWNDVSNASLQTDDTGGIYTEGITNAVSLIEYNYVHVITGISDSHSVVSHVSAGIYLDNNSGGFTVNNNVVYDAHAAMVINPTASTPISVTNNTFDPNPPGVSTGYCFLSKYTSYQPAWTFHDNLLECSASAQPYSGGTAKGNIPVGDSQTGDSNPNLVVVDPYPVPTSFAGFVSPAGISQGALLHGTTPPLVGLDPTLWTTVMIADIQESYLGSAPSVLLNFNLQSSASVYNPIYNSLEYSSLVTTSIGGTATFDFTGTNYVQLANGSYHSLSLTVARSDYVYLLVQIPPLMLGQDPSSPWFNGFSNQWVELGSSNSTVNFAVYRSDARVSAGEVYTINIPDSNTSDAFMAIIAQFN